MWRLWNKLFGWDYIMLNFGNKIKIHRLYQLAHLYYIYGEDGYKKVLDVRKPTFQEYTLTLLTFKIAKKIYDTPRKNETTK